jgi:hypothetical protein
MNMKTLKQKPLLALALVFFIAMPLLAVNSAHADGSAVGTVYVSSSSGTSITVPDTPYPIGTEVVVDIKISGAQHIWGWKVDVNWNGDVLALQSVVEGTNFLTTMPTESTLTTFSEPLWKNVAGNGYVESGLSSRRLSATETARTSGTLATMTFVVIASGSSDIVISDATLTDKYNLENSSPTISTSTISVTVGGSYAGPSFSTYDNSGVETTVFDQGTQMNIMGTNFPANGVYDIYVIPHQTSIGNGFDLTMGGTITPTTVFVDENGDIALTEIVASTVPGEYDVVVDGYYSTLFSTGAGDIVLSNVQGVPTMVVPEYTFGTIVALAACFVALLAFTASKKGLNLPTVSKHIA